jgi:hypothetical protein
MTTAQELRNGHCVSPPFLKSQISDIKPPVAPATLGEQPEAKDAALEARCQFTFSDGRRCTMGRSDIHPSLCPYHAEREEQLFGVPSSGGTVFGRAFDFRLPRPHLRRRCEPRSRPGLSPARAKAHFAARSRHLRPPRPTPVADHFPHALLARKSWRSGAFAR